MAERLTCAGVLNYSNDVPPGLKQAQNGYSRAIAFSLFTVSSVGCFRAVLPGDAFGVVFLASALLTDEAPSDGR